jgi:hypothetical protein
VTQTIGERLEQQGTGFVARELELALLRLVLADDGPVVVFVHGIGGVGKSALLEEFGREARGLGAVVLRIDGGAIEPSVRGFLEALAGRAGRSLASPASAAARLASLGPRVILTIDRYESLGSLDPWLRQVLIPALPSSVRVILAGRAAPAAEWPLRLGRLFRSLPLGNLPRNDAEHLLRRIGVGPADAERINRLARGHPLSLRLAAAAMIAGPALDPDATTITALLEELTRLYLAKLDGPTRRALDAASMVRRATLSLLGAMLPHAAPQDAFDRLRSLPFIELTTDGLVVHDTIREVVAAYLRASDPDGARRYRIAAWRRLRDEVANAPRAEMRRYSADLLYLLEHPAVREAWFPTSDQRHLVEVARPDDWPDILRFSGLQYPGESISDVEAWWRELPGAFRVARDGMGTAVGFSVLTELDRIPRRLVDADPVARAWRDHLRANPVPRGQVCSVYRFERADPANPDQLQVHAALNMDLPRTWMELRPSIRRHYLVGREPWSGDDDPLDQRPLPASPLVMNGVTRHLAVIDFGPLSVDGWLTKLIATELRVEEDTLLDAGQRQLVLATGRVDLSALEFGVLQYLVERAGTVVDRASLLQEVWGYDDAGGSNVMEAVVSSLRRKLGDRAAVIETVRGLGYRFVPSG